jgi:hypothetical protein
MINRPLGISEEIRLMQLSRRCAEALSESRSQRPDERATSDHWLRFVCEVAKCELAEARDSTGHAVFRIGTLDDVRLDFSKALKALSGSPDANPKDPNNPALWSKPRRIFDWLRIIKELTGEDMSDDTFGRRMKRQKIYTPHPDRVGKMVRLLLSSLPTGYDDSK